MCKRWIALDVGDKRIGVAVSDAMGIIAQPAGMIERVGWGPDIRQIAEYASEYGTNKIVCGMPRNMDGSYGPQAEKVQAFIVQLENKGFDVVCWDERLSTVTAERTLVSAGVSRAARKGVIDQTAAVVILQAFLDAKQGGNENDNGT